MFDDISKSLTNALNDATKSVESEWDSVTGSARTAERKVGNDVAAALKDAKDAVEDARKSADSAVERIRSEANSAADRAEKSVDRIDKQIDDTLDGVKSNVDKVRNAVDNMEKQVSKTLGDGEAARAIGAARKAVDDVTGVIDDAADRIKSAVDGVRKGFDDAVEGARNAINGALDKVEGAIDDVAQKVEDAVDKVGEGLKDIETKIDASLNVVSKAFKDAVSTFENRTIGTVTTLCPHAVDSAVAAAAGGAASVMSLPLPTAVLRGLRRLINSKPSPDKGLDGYLLTPDGARCRATPPTDAAKDALSKPAASDAKRKIIFVNGIRNDKEAACDTLQAIAKATGADVAAVYNATDGFLGDLEESIDNIRRAGTAPATGTLSDTIHDYLASDPPNTRPLEIFAHSQGGLITQEALIDAKNRLFVSLSAGKTKDRMDDVRAEVERRMSSIKVSSFGTATEGWPVGPRYTQYTNEADPVPRVIRAARNNNRSDVDRDNDKSAESVRFDDPRLNPLAAHSMKTYLDHLRDK